MNARSIRYFLILIVCLASGPRSTPAAIYSTAFGISRQINVNNSQDNIASDAANEPSMAIDPTDPNHIAVGWRQFDSILNNFRQAGYGYSTNGGLNWSFPGVLQPGVLRSDPVLASDANGTFYYLGLSNTVTFNCDLWRSTNGGKNWILVGPALGGDKEWMTIDTTPGPGRGNIYQLWSPFANSYANSATKLFTRSIDGGATWLNAVALPQQPFAGTLDVGPNGEVYTVGESQFSDTFVVSRSTNAWNRLVTPIFDLTANIDLGGPLLFGLPQINPVGLLGQASIAVDRSAELSRGNVYILCTVSNHPGNLANVMFSRSIDRGKTWSTPWRINDDSPNQNACHWFGTLSVAPNGRVDVCWYDTRASSNHSSSELYYSWSEDGGQSWAPNRRLSPAFNHSVGFPNQAKIGDYISMISLQGGACITYAATFNGEQDLYFVRAELPISARIVRLANLARISWNSVPGVSYCVEAKPGLNVPWATATNIACFVATNTAATVDYPLPATGPPKFYRVVRNP